MKPPSTHTLDFLVLSIVKKNLIFSVCFSAGITSSLKNHA